MVKKFGFPQIIWLTCLGLILALMLAMASTIVLASAAPFHPGDGLFYALQQPVEQALVRLDRRPSGQARRLLDLARRRTADLSRLAGTVHEPDAVNELERSLLQAVQAAAAARQEDTADLRPQLVGLLKSVEETLPTMKVAPVQNPQQWADFLAWESQIARMAANPHLILASLVPDPQPKPARMAVEPLPTPTAVPTPTSVQVVTPQAVWFPPGSPGALHAFYPLTGKHISLECKDCHPLGEYAGTPALCISCHGTQAPANHFQGDCLTCHTTAGWIPAHFDHSLSIAAGCQDCHLKDRPAQHYPGQCSACHSTNAWKPAHFDHAVAGATDCQSCHARPDNHYRGQCSACHATSAWKPAHFNHEAAGATDCQSCHQRPGGHFNGQCSACHSTGAWKPANFNHAAAGATDCQSCHNRPASHFPGQCSDCHSTSTWSGASFNHSFPINHGGANGQCAACHPGGFNSWSCASCHDPGSMDGKHREVAGYSSNCLQCHAGGQHGED